MIKILLSLLTKLISPALVYFSGRSAGVKSKEIEKLNEEINAIRIAKKARLNLNNSNISRRVRKRFTRE